MSYSLAMADGRMNIDELAAEAAISPRAIRFYVQRGLLAAPLGKGRGRHYDASHLKLLQRLQQLQAAGHSLEAIRKILAGGQVPNPPQRAAGQMRAVPRATMTAGLWTRLVVADGVELHLDASKHNATVEQLMAARQALRAILASGGEAENAPAGDGRGP